MLFRSVSIRARHCWRANRRCNQHGRGLAGFNPRPPLLAGESSFALHGSPVVSKVSIRARHCWRANRVAHHQARCAGVVSIRARHCWRANRSGCGRTRRFAGFNPRPPLLAGESLSLLLALGVLDGVSIRARHCWRANRRCNQHGRGLAGFNPRPPLLAGESPSGHRRWSDSQGFNPRPPLLAGESSLIQSMEGTWVFQSAPAIAGGRIFALLLT